MADYRAMYHKIFNRVSDVIEALQAVQLETEGMYLETDDPAIHILNTDDDSNTSDEKKEQENE